MPEIRSYIVTETRQVKVEANSASDAARIASKALEEGQIGNGKIERIFGVWGNTTSDVRVIRLDVEEGR